MLVLTRFRRPPDDPGDAGDPGDPGDPTFRSRLAEALSVLSEQTGFVEGRIGRNVDDPGLWVLQTLWDGPGAYRRALSAYDVKMRAWTVLGEALDEPTAYELVTAGDPLNEARPRRNR